MSEIGFLFGTLFFLSLQLLIKFLLHLLAYVAFVFLLFLTLAPYAPLHECSNYDQSPLDRINFCEDALNIPEVKKEANLRSSTWIHIGIAHSELSEHCMALIAFERAIYEAMDGHRFDTHMVKHLQLLKENASREALDIYFDARAKTDIAPIDRVSE